MNEEKFSPYSQCCGRRFAPVKPKCNYCDACTSEYCGKMPACIRKKQPDCMAKAVIPAVTVDNVDGITNLANCFVHVTSNNTTYYVDDKHRPMIIWAGPVETTLPPDIDSQEEFDEFIKSFNLHSQELYVKIHLTDPDDVYVYDMFYFDKAGNAYFWGELYPVGGGLI